MKKLAVDGGVPVRVKMLPYGHQWIDDQDIVAVVNTLRSDWLTTGPRIAEFEAAFANRVGAKYAIAVSSGTAALHAASHVAGIQLGDEVIVPAITFVASANCVVYCGGTPIFADVEPGTLLLDPNRLEEKLTKKTKAVISVDYAGHPVNYDHLHDFCNQHNLVFISDACHALGAEYWGKKVGSLADLNTFSFHPVKHISTGEGGMITTNGADRAKALRIFRSHGIATDHRQREEANSWFYEMVDLGYNYRITDFQCALGLSQLAKLENFLKRRRAIAVQYDKAFSQIQGVQPLSVRGDATHAYHLYVIRLDLEALKATRQDVYRALRAEGIGVNVHYIPVHLHPFYQNQFGTKKGDCPVAEAAYERLLSLPIFPSMRDRDIEDVIAAVFKVCEAYRR